jgi:hypothetical protein
MKNLVIVAMSFALAFSIVKIVNQARALNTFGAYQKLSADHLELIKYRHGLELSKKCSG